MMVCQFIFLILSNWILFFIYKKTSPLTMSINILILSYALSLAFYVFFSTLYSYNFGLLSFLIVIPFSFLLYFILISLYKKIKSKTVSKLKLLYRKKHENILVRILEFITVTYWPFIIISATNYFILFNNYKHFHGYGRVIFLLKKIDISFDVASANSLSVIALSSLIFIFILMQLIIGLFFSWFFIYKPYIDDENADPISLSNHIPSPL